MSRKKKSYYSSSNNSKSQRRLALTVLVLIIACGSYFGISDDNYVSNLINGLGGSDNVEYVSTDSGESNNSNSEVEKTGNGVTMTLAEDNLPEYDGNLYVEINNNIPVFPMEAFTEAGLVNENGTWKTKESSTGKVRGIDSSKLISYEYYGALDELGRCTIAYGCLSPDTMPMAGESRGDISRVHPSGWAKGQGWERGHLIAWALSAENANECNLVTSTHQMNNEAIRPFEETVEHYIWNTGRHVLYMAKPWYYGDELIPRGVQMTAWSIEDKGDAISFNVYCFNVTEGAEIDYTTGIVTTEAQAAQSARQYVVNMRSKYFHYPSCESVSEMSKNNKKVVTATRSELVEDGYKPCGYCQP